MTHINTFEAELAAHAALSRREEVSPLRFKFWSTPLEIVETICQSDCDECEPFDAEQEEDETFYLIEDLFRLIGDSITGTTPESLRESMLLGYLYESDHGRLDPGETFASWLRLIIEDTTDALLGR